MNKILTVSVASYNVEKYIQNTLESCLVPEIIDDIEVLIIDDGGKDKTVELATPYAQKYPDTFRIIHKENGGYGTTVNLAVQLAQGKYFRLLDGDDWFDKKGLRKLVQVLKETDADALFTQMYQEYPDREVLAEDAWKDLAGKSMRMSQIPHDVWAGMWEFTVRTQILKDHQFLLPSKTLYTDHIFLMYPIPYIQKVEFLEFPLYCYRLGYDEQSVSASSRLKHLDEILKVSEILSNYYHDVCRNSDNKHYALERARFCYMEAYRALLLLPCSVASMKAVKAFDENLRKIDTEVYEAAAAGVGSKSLRLMRSTGYYGYFAVKLKYYLRKKLK